MPRNLTIPEIRVNVSKHAPPRILLDWARKSLKFDGQELSGLLTESTWRFLVALALRRSKAPGLVIDGEDILARDAAINGAKAKASNLRREVQRQLPKGLARLIVQTVHGVGFRLSTNVHVPRSSEAKIRFYSPNDLEKLDSNVS